MSLDKFKRVCYLLRERHGQENFTRTSIDNAIAQEIGTNRRTIKHSYEDLKRFHFIKGIFGTNQFFITKSCGC